MDRSELERRATAAIELRKRKENKTTVFGVVCPKKGFSHSIKRVCGQWVETEDSPDIYIAAKIERVVKSIKRFIVLIGGRGSTKSVAAVDIAVADAKDNNGRTYFLREYQSSIKNSVHSLVKSETKRFGYVGFEALAQSINYNGESVFEFAGIARNIDSVKSTHGFKRFEIEEAQFISQASLDVLTPSLRNEPKNGLPTKFSEQEEPLIIDIGTHPDLKAVSMIFVANPGSSGDPFSKRFIEPYKSIINKNGYYEDDLHLIVKINYDDNPWFEDSGLESERLWDYNNRERAYYDHKWLGEYNDTIENAIIKPEWFDAAIDAHVKLGFEGRGAIVATHDPSDNGEGSDPRGYAARHGSVVIDVDENTSKDVNDACDWAVDKAISVGADHFSWDCDGLGVTLKRQVKSALDGKKIDYHMFKGSEAVERPSEIYQGTCDSDRQKEKTNKESFKNKRAQYYIRLADRFYNSYRAIVKKEYIDPDAMISLSSDIKDLAGLKSEVCRIPLKDNGSGLIQIMSKPEMKKLGIVSPNKADCLMMLMMIPQVVKKSAPAPAFTPRNRNWGGGK